MHRATVFAFFLLTIACRATDLPKPASQEGAASVSRAASPTERPARATAAEAEAPKEIDTEAAARAAQVSALFAHLPRMEAGLSSEERYRIAEGVDRAMMPAGVLTDECSDCASMPASRAILDEFSSAMDRWTGAWNVARDSAEADGNKTADIAEAEQRAACLHFEKEKRNALVAALYRSGADQPKWIVVENAADVADQLSISLQRCAQPGGFAIFRDALTKNETPCERRMSASAVVHYLSADYQSAQRLFGQIFALPEGRHSFSFNSRSPEKRGARSTLSRIRLYQSVFQHALSIRGKNPVALSETLTSQVEQSGDDELRLRYRLIVAHWTRQRGLLFAAAKQMDDLLRCIGDRSFGVAAKSPSLRREIYMEAAAAFEAVGDLQRADEIYHAALTGSPLISRYFKQSAAIDGGIGIGEKN